MNSLKLLLAFSISCFLTLNTIAQPTQEWFASYNGTGPESHGHFILTCSDGGFLQIGETGYIPNSAKILVVKTDATGGLLWQKEFNSSSGHNLGNSAYELSDGYLICGALNKNSALIKLNKSTGNTIFNQTYNNGGTDAIEHIAETTSGFVAVGYINALDENNTFYTEGAGYLTFIDAAGNKTNGININAYTSQAYRIKEYNGALIVSGLSIGAEEYNLMKFDFSGNIIWNQNFGGNSDDHCFGMDINAMGDIFLTGHTISGTQNWDTYTMKISSSGSLIWDKKTGNPRGFDPNYIHDEAWGIKATSDGGCVIVAGTGDEYNNYSDCNTDGCSDVWRTYLVKYDASGNVEWQQTYFANNSIDWAGEDIDLTSDGGAIVGVDSGTFGFLKLSPFSASPSQKLQAKVFLEGAYQGNGTMNTGLQSAGLLPLAQPFNRSPWNYAGTETASAIPTNATDWLLLEVRDAQNETQIIEMKAAFVANDGTIMDIDGSAGVSFSNLANGTAYYLVIRSRNHLAVVSKNGISLPQTTAYDFSDENNVRGANQLNEMADGFFAMSAGDFNSDGVITVTDFNDYQQEISAINSYVDGDYSLDGNVTTGDFNTYRPNASKIGISLVRY